MTTARPYMPVGSYDKKPDANRAAQEMSNATGQRWIPCKASANSSKFAIVRKDEK